MNAVYESPAAHVVMGRLTQSQIPAAAAREDRVNR